MLRLYPVATHVAEKLHAFTLPRSRENTRVKDLPDLALLATSGPLLAAELKAALNQTFTARRAQPIPDRLPAPPPSWERPYQVMAAKNGLRWRTLGEVTEAAAAFLDPVLAGSACHCWDPAAWTWSAAE